jgi:hypothetical protein
MFWLVHCRCPGLLLSSECGFVISVVTSTVRPPFNIKMC